MESLCLSYTTLQTKNKMGMAAKDRCQKYSRNALDIYTSLTKTATVQNSFLTILKNVFSPKHMASFLMFTQSTLGLILRGSVD